MIAASASGDEKAETTPGLSQWAIIATGDPETRGVADLLTAELSNRPDIRLVERERIDSVLRDLNLSVSGLADQSKAIQLGKLLTADAMVLIEREAGSPTMRVRFVESRSGIRLWDDLRKVSLDQPVIQRLATDLQAAGRKLKVPAQKRRTVSIMGIVAEKQDVDLVNAARSLHAFLERDLQACDDVVVLERERERLKHLVAERDLTGVELELWSTAVLIEGSVRHAGAAKQFVLGIKLSRPDGGVLSSLEVQSDEPGLESLRADLLSKVLLALDATASKPRGGESFQFAIRADQLRNHGLYAEALDSAYAALALAPTRDNYRRVRDLHTQLVTLWYRPPQWRPGVTALVLEDATLAHEADLRQLEIGVREGGKLFDMSIGRALVDPFIPHVPIDFSESAEVQAQRAALDQIRLAKYQLLHEACAGNSEDLLNVLIPRLHLAAYFAKDEADYVASVLALQGEIDRAIDQVEPTDRWRLLFIGENARALRQALFM
ncbi:MAG: CsgG/HfaB family protein, partial [Betaproteobacteria bacterium]